MTLLRLDSLPSVQKKQIFLGTIYSSILIPATNQAEPQEQVSHTHRNPTSPPIICQIRATVVSFFIPNPSIPTPPRSLARAGLNQIISSLSLSVRLFIEQVCFIWTLSLISSIIVLFVNISFLIRIGFFNRFPTEPNSGFQIVYLKKREKSSFHYLYSTWVLASDMVFVFWNLGLSKFIFLMTSSRVSC